jgi:hypothetical protein
MEGSCWTGQNPQWAVVPVEEEEEEEEEEDGDILEDLDVNGRILQKCIFKISDGGVEWIDPILDRDRWPVALNAVVREGY